LESNRGAMELWEDDACARLRPFGETTTTGVRMNKKRLFASCVIVALLSVVGMTAAVRMVPD